MQIKGLSTISKSGMSASDIICIKLACLRVRNSGKGRVDLKVFFRYIDGNNN